MSQESKVKVAVRIRPLLVEEEAQGSTSCVEVLSKTELIVGQDKQFTFDYVFGPSSVQHEVYDEAVDALIDSLFEGYNATVFAYGQTGSGKTFTMGSGCLIPNHASEDSLGVIPRAVQRIFGTIAERKAEQSANEYYLRVQFLELYGETLKDLLDPVGTSRGKRIQVRDGDSGSLQTIGASEESVKTLNETLMALERGSLCRTTGSTVMNAHSSRSHAIFTIILEQQVRTDISSPEMEFRISKFHLVDLAGSERAKRTGATGVRLREGIDINKGLLALGNVISALGSDDVAPKFVNYRDSKLTRILQDSLGGNSRTLMVACVSPADSNYEETLNALRYANRARNIKNRAVINRDPSSSMVALLKAEVARLKQQLAQSSSGSQLSVSDNRSTSLSGDDPQKLFLQEEVNRLAGALDAECKLRVALEDRLANLETERSAMLGSVEVSEDESSDDAEAYLGHDDELNGRLSDLINSRDRGESSASSDGRRRTQSDFEKIVHVEGEEIDQVDEEENGADGKYNDELVVRFKNNQRVLRQLARKYDATLHSKEEAMRQIEEERARFETFKHHFEGKMKEMDEEVRLVKEQREELKHRLMDLEKSVPMTATLSAETQRVKSQMAEKEHKLRELEDKAKQLEATRRAAMEWQKRESQVRGEIEKLKSNQAELQRKMAENHKRHVQELQERKLEIAGLERERTRLEHDTSLLSAQVNRDSKLIQSKSSQVAAMQKKLREALKSASRTSLSREQAEMERQQREEIERLAALHVQREEELIALRRALAKKELAIMRRVRLAEKLKRLKEEDTSTRVNAPPPTTNDGDAVGVVDPMTKNVALDDLMPSSATREDVAELEMRLEAIDSEILFRNRECEQALNTETNSDIQDDGKSGLDASANTSTILSFHSLEQAKELCRLLMGMFVEGKRENRDLKRDLQKAESKLQENNRQIREERLRMEAILKTAGESSKASIQLPHQQETTKADPQSRIHSIEEKLKSLEARPFEDDHGFVGERRDTEHHQQQQDGEKKTWRDGQVFVRLTSPSALTGIHKYGQREKPIVRSAFVRRKSKSQWTQTSKLPSQSTTEDGPHTTLAVADSQAEKSRHSVSPVARSSSSRGEEHVHGNLDASELTGLSSSLIEDDHPEDSFSSARSMAKIDLRRGWERVASQTTESFSQKRSTQNGEANSSFSSISSSKSGARKRSTWKKRNSASPRSPSVSPASILQRSPSLAKTPASVTSSPLVSTLHLSSQVDVRVPVYERLSDPKSFTGIQRHVHQTLHNQNMESSPELPNTQ